LADNRVAEYSTWDSELLNIELSQFETIDMAQFGFELSVTGLTLVTRRSSKRKLKTRRKMLRIFTETQL
ncbi:hypothetical protein LAJ56_10570, partial [Streptococcus pneumoniae]|nr:hypothetical protein [Streptococcus pneumoniae]